MFLGVRKPSKSSKFFTKKSTKYLLVGPKGGPTLLITSLVNNVWQLGLLHTKSKILFRSKLNLSIFSGVKYLIVFPVACIKEAITSLSLSKCNSFILSEFNIPSISSPKKKKEETS